MASTALATPPAIRSWSTRAISQKAIRKLFPDNRAADAFEAHFMSRKLGNELPATLLSLLDGNDLPARMGKAILITTVDVRGQPYLEQPTPLRTPDYVRDRGRHGVLREDPCIGAAGLAEASRARAFRGDGGACARGPSARGPRARCADHPRDRVQRSQACVGDARGLGCRAQGASRISFTC